MSESIVTDQPNKAKHEPLYRSKLCNLLFEMDERAILILQDGRIIDSNRQAATLLGVAQEALLGQTLLEYSPTIQPDGRDSAISLQQNVAAGSVEKPVQFEWVVQLSNGQQIWTTVTWNQVERDGETYSFVWLYDITRDKLRETALQEERNLLRFVVDTVSDHIYAKDRAGCYTFANLAMARSLGVDSPTEVLGQTDFDFFPIEFAKKFQASDQAFIAGNKPTLFQEDEVLDEATGQTSWVATNKVQWRDEQDQVLGLVGIDRDISECKLAETIRLREERFSLATANSGVGIWDWDIVNDTLYWSPELKAMHGYMDDELESDFETFSSMVHPDDKNTGATLRAHLKEGTPYELEQRIRHKSGEYRWFWVYGQAVFDEAGQPIRMTGTNVDINKQKQVEEDLRLGEERFSLAMANSGVGIWDWDIVNDTLYWSPELKALLGYTDDELTIDFEAFSSMLHSDDKGTMVALEAHLKEGTPYELEQRIRHKSGEYRWFRVWGQAIFDEAGQPIRMTGTTVDINDRKQAEEALRLSEGRLAFATGNSGIGIFEWDIVNDTLYWSPELKALFGYADDELEASFEIFSSMLHPDDKETEAALEAHLNEGAPYEIEQRMRHKSGEYRWFRVWGQAIFDGAGQPIRMTGTGVDISDRKQAEERANQAKKAAETANQAKSTFLTNMSHELRSPLNSILGFSNLLRREVANGRSPFSPDQQESLSLIHQSGEHLLAMINNVLDLSKIEAGKEKLNETSFDLHRLLSDIEDMFAARANEQNLSMAFERSERVPNYVRTDETKLRQVLINLLSNSVKFTEKGGVIVRVDSVPLMQNDGRSDRVTLKFEVADTGPGIAPEEMDVVFEAFAQTRAGRSAREGTGLGLSISQQFVCMMGGDIAVQSKVGEGSIFSFDVPVTAVAHTEVEVSERVSQVAGLAANQDEYRILIVDDNEINRKLLVKLLQPLGFAVREAVDGQEGIAIWEEWRPHLIWMDIRMPVLDGYEATKLIKGSDQGQQTKVLALTASSFEEERAVALAVGCDDFLRKPYRENELFEMMREHLGIEYVYADEAAGETAVTPSPSTDLDIAQALAALPEELLTRLEAAAVRANMAEVDALIEEVKVLDTAVAARLAKLAEQFDYPRIAAQINRTVENKP